jgi:formate hydrogenlyase subunit 3/multisubunit Na+/H+ antiporter MnhD subunit
MLPLFGLMLAGYAFGAALAVLSPGGRVARRLVAAGVVVGAGAGLALALAALLTGAVFVLEVPAVLSGADGLLFRLDTLGAFFLGLVGLVAIPCGMQSLEYRSEIVPWFERYLYAPLVSRVRRWGIQARAIQSGSAHAYLAYLVIALVGLLTLLLVRQM